MFKLIADEIKLIVERVKAGNAYREELYENVEEVKPRSLRSYGPEKTLPMWPSTAELHTIELQKMQYQYWDEWTGGRYDRVENPYMNREYFDKHASFARKSYINFIDQLKYGEVIRSNAVTGYWEPLNHIDSEMV